MLPSQGELGAVSSPLVIWKSYVEKYYIFSAHLAEFLSVAIGLESYCLKKKKAFCYKFNPFNERAVTQMHVCLEQLR